MFIPKLRDNDKLSPHCHYEEHSNVVISTLQIPIKLLNAFPPERDPSSQPACDELSRVEADPPQAEKTAGRQPRLD